MYKLDFSPAGRDSLASLDKKVAQRALDKLRWLLRNIDNISAPPLKRNLSGLYKLRVGDWRVIYEVKRDQRVVTVHKVGHRSEIYR
ncbi:MAG: type II toxin-antitoxin system RelE/ParE family toxin [Deltaproteobacteria bacterium]|nr:type II toxin-antitoxin system RelE/ParE family toxin [Deltaproteobacteria bacterium]MBW2333183.1 type II toxin-antitoxin system RelE/ParE family toxin [Deltaproteobacteria bacterium]RLB20851.1 MAG: type II toxin-antitoxin system mRNA interferase toxin, RelE/StbE family [Deltaproteobacteria bacterium]